jgi:hypothetical protein
LAEVIAPVANVPGEILCYTHPSASWEFRAIALKVASRVRCLMAFRAQSG